MAMVPTNSNQLYVYLMLLMYLMYPFIHIVEGKTSYYYLRKMSDSPSIASASEGSEYFLELTCRKIVDNESETSENTELFEIPIYLTQI